MDNEQSLDLLQNKPKGLLEQLKYFEYELAKLEEQKGNTDLKRRIRREIDNLRYDISVYKGLLNESKPDLEKGFSEGEKLFDEVSSLIKSELKYYPYKKVYLLAGLIGVSIATLIQSAINSYYILLFISLTLLLICGYLFYRKSKLSMIKRGVKNLNDTVNLMKKIAEKIELIEALKQEIFFAQKRNDSKENSNKHFENSEWLEEKVLEFESKGESQNKALELSMELYEREFDRKPPGKTTILRYMGRAE